MLPQLVGKGLRPFPTAGLHAGRSPLTSMIGVIFAAHVTENDGFDFVSAVRGGNFAKLFPELFVDRLEGAYP